MKKLSAYAVYGEYMALKSHFNTTYDYFKYNHKIKSVTPKAFAARRDRYIFEKLSKYDNPVHFLISNFVKNPSMWIGDMIGEDATKNYKEWSKRIQSLSYTFKQQLQLLSRDFDSNIKIVKNEHPTLIKLYLSEKIDIETLIIIVDVARCFSYWDKNLDSNDVIWKEIKQKYNKYKPFLKYDREKFRKIILEEFENTK